METSKKHAHRTFKRVTNRPKKKQKEAIRIAAGSDGVVSGTFLTHEFDSVGVLQKLTITVDSLEGDGEFIVLIQKRQEGRTERQQLTAKKGANLAGDFNVQAGDRLQISFVPVNEASLVGVWVSGTFMSDARVYE